jgi:hypothetical protein
MRALRRNTELVPHLSPLAVEMPRVLSPSAMACNVVAPLARISTMIGASSVACASAFSTRTWGPLRRFGQGRSIVIGHPTHRELYLIPTAVGLRRN